MTNPPFINKCIFNPLKDEIYFGLLNGALISLKNNLKTNFVKLAHTLMIRDMRIYNFDKEILITLGKERNLKVINLNEGEIKFCIDLSEFKDEDPFLVESDVLGNIYYADTNTNNLKLIKFKN